MTFLFLDLEAPVVAFRTCSKEDKLALDSSGWFLSESCPLADLNGVSESSNLLILKLYVLYIELSGVVFLN